MSASTDPAAAVLAARAQPVDRSAARLLLDGVEAFTWRAQSIRGAQRSIDVQMYLWRGDVTGRLLAHELLAAADRGVCVRVLLDDWDARSRDAVLIALDGHRDLHIRLFNPFVTRSGVLRTLIEVFAHGARLNRRMHNKCWIVDGAQAVLGGRNIGDEYFAASSEVNFVDADVVLTGPAVTDAMRTFEEYWSCALTAKVSYWRRLGRRGHRLRRVRAALAAAARAALNTPYVQRLRDAAPAGISDARSRFTQPTRVCVVADPPQKASGASIARGVLRSVIEAIESAQRELLLISPYFVPGAGGAAALRALRLRGVRVSVLTNSLAATDVAAVHSGYARYREALLEAGVELYELKSAIGREHARRIRLGSSRASLHTKAIIVDGVRLFVGSFNLDPRSAELNCEMGVWLDDELLAAEMHAMFAAMTSLENSYVVSLDAAGRTQWRETIDGRTERHARDPHASGFRRGLAWLLQRLPIEAQL